MLNPPTGVEEYGEVVVVGVAPVVGVYVVVGVVPVIGVVPLVGVVVTGVGVVVVAPELDYTIQTNQITISYELP